MRLTTTSRLLVEVKEYYVKYTFGGVDRYAVDYPVSDITNSASHKVSTNPCVEPLE